MVETKSNGKLILIDDPLKTTNVDFLEEILAKADGRRFLNAVQFGSIGGNFGEFSDYDKEPINEFLPGGTVIRKRYLVKEIQQRYDHLK